MPLSKPDLLIRCSQATHEVTRIFLCAVGDPTPREWDVPWFELSDDLQVVTMKLVERILLGERDPSILHASWAEDMLKIGWRWGLDPEDYQHPCLVYYDELPAHQKRRLDLALSVTLGLMARHGG